MTTLSRRDVVLVGLTGLVSIKLISTAAAQNAPANVSGRARDHKGDPAKKLKCYLSGTDNVPIRGTYDEMTGEFNFKQTPKGSVLLVKLHYNGEVFPYPVMNPSEKSRLEVSFPPSGSKWTANEPPPANSDVVSALGAIASFAMQLRVNNDVLTDFLKDGGWVDTKSTLTIIGKIVDLLKFANEAEKKLLTNLYANTDSLWNTFG
jgi:hypothetical protein